MGGHDVREYLARLLIKEGFSPRKAVDISKNKACYAAQVAELDSPLPPHFQCVESLFNPSLLRLRFAGIHHLIYTSIMKCEPDVHKDLFSYIVLSGGSTMFPGFAKRLQEELIALAPPSTKINIVASTQQRYLPWFSGSKLATLPKYQRIWMTRQEYEESGADYSRATL